MHMHMNSAREQKERSSMHNTERFTCKRVLTHSTITQENTSAALLVWIHDDGGDGGGAMVMMVVMMMMVTVMMVGHATCEREREWQDGEARRGGIGCG